MPWRAWCDVITPLTPSDGGDVAEHANGTGDASPVRTNAAPGYPESPAQSSRGVLVDGGASAATGSGRAKGLTAALNRGWPR